MIVRALPPPIDEAALAAIAAQLTGDASALSGMPRTGKSYLAKEADNAGLFGERRVVTDRYYIRDRREIEQGAPGSVWQHDPGELLTANELAMCPEILERTPLRAVIYTTSESHAQLAKEWTLVAKLCRSVGGIHLVTEESAFLRDVPAARELLLDWATGCGHWQGRLTCITQSIDRLYIEVRKALSLIICYAQGSPEDLLAIKRRCGKAFMQLVALLKKGTSTQPGDRPKIWQAGDGLT